MSTRYVSQALWVALRDANEVVRVDAVAKDVVARVPLGASPYAIAAGERGVWVASYEDASVFRIDPAQNRIAAVIGVPPKPNALVVGAGGVWVRGLTPGETVVRIDPSTNEAAIVDVDGIPVAAGNGVLWLDRHHWADTSAIIRLDPVSGQTTELFEGANIWNVTPSLGGIWFTYSAQGGWVLAALDEASSVAPRRMPLSEHVEAPRGVRAVDDEVVVGAMLRSGVLPRGSRDGPFALLRVNAQTMRTTGSLVVDELEDFAMVDREVWVSQHDRRRLVVVDAATMTEAALLPLPGHPGPIATLSLNPPMNGGAERDHPRVRSASGWSSRDSA